MNRTANAIAFSTLAFILSALLPSLSAAQATPAASPTASLTPAFGATPSAVRAQVSPSPIAAVTPTPPLDRGGVLTYLGQTITWHRQTDTQARLVSAPDETLFFADDRRMADDVLKQAFDFAHAASDLLRDIGPDNSSNQARPNLGSSDKAPHVNELITRRGELKSSLADLKTQLQDLRDRLSKAGRRHRDTINRDIATVQAQSDLAQSRVDSLDAMIAFEQSTGVAAPSGFDAQIDELQRSVQPVSSTNPPPVAATAQSTPSTGLIGSAELLYRLSRKQSALDNNLDSSDQLSKATARLRSQLLAMLREIDRRGLEAGRAVSGATDIAAAQQIKAQFDQLTTRGKLISKAILPLSKQSVTLELYASNVARWRDAVHQEFLTGLRRLLIRAAILFFALIIVFVAASIWRRLAFRYVTDPQHRYRLLRVRRVLVLLAVALVLLFAFANELGSLATVAGLAAAGIAVALQNVILSIAGYFYLSGRFGLKRGDRVELAGITGDVLEIGFFKLTLMELAGDDRGRQPTGRVVVFPNSIVFQSNSNLFRQLPGTTFRWTEMRLSVTPDPAYHLAEERLTAIVNEVFARYRDAIVAEYRSMESELGIAMDSPRPQTRLQFSSSGLDLIVRFPVRLRSSIQTIDEITRRLVDAIAREPGLTITPSSAPIIQSAPHPSTPSDAPPPSAHSDSASAVTSTPPGSTQSPTKSGAR